MRGVYLIESDNPPETKRVCPSDLVHERRLVAEGI